MPKKASVKPEYHQGVRVNKKVKTKKTTEDRNRIAEETKSRNSPGRILKLKFGEKGNPTEFLFNVGAPWGNEKLIKVDLQRLDAVTKNELCPIDKSNGIFAVTDDNSTRGNRSEIYLSLEASLKLLTDIAAALKSIAERTAE